LLLLGSPQGGSQAGRLKEAYLPPGQSQASLLLLGLRRLKWELLVIFFTDPHMELLAKMNMISLMQA
jgi:hypothetical protein